MEGCICNYFGGINLGKALISCRNGIVIVGKKLSGEKFFKPFGVLA